MQEKNRCPWANSSELMRKYHDEEWGVPLHDDTRLFEFLTLETFQAGLSWAIVLNKREGFRQAFAGFDPSAVAGFAEADYERLINDAAIIRNRQKIQAAINNARQFLEVQREFGSFAKYAWGFVGGKPIQNASGEDSQIPPYTEVSDKFSTDLKKRGFKFVGTTVIYAHMQATGMVNDHLITCPRYKAVQSLV